METLVVNLFGGPDVGKSTSMAAIFAQLKIQQVSCEMAPEFAKDKVWEGSAHVLDNQIYVFGKQHHRIARLDGKVGVIICDSPLLNSILYYRGSNPHFAPAVFVEFNRFHNLNVVLARPDRPYDPSGRLQTEEQAKLLDAQVVRILDFLKQDYHIFPLGPTSHTKIAEFATDAYKLLNGS